ncbi:ThuA domain-containing protein [Glycomyces salinus]|uniref:ThuA domain-containing protein n=1 Tax=Glycomyces salinus TaxID=980294 RepID=UPI0018EE4717|nr:ThuA domain-containing protein [Glycomyces salinus]
MRIVLRLTLVAVLACVSALAPAAAAGAADQPRVLAVTAGNVDAETAQYALERLHMEARRWQFELVEGEPSDLADLGGFDVVMLLNTSGDILDAAERESVESFVEGGGGLVATNTAAVTEPDWTWWQEALGATALEPPVTPAHDEEVSFNAGNPITEGLDEDLELKESWYFFDPEPSEPESTVLARMESGDPVAWSSEEHRLFYSAAGGWFDTWGERDFLQLVRQGIWWAAGETGPMEQFTGDAAPPWPYTFTFILFVLAVAGGGSIAVWRLDRAEPDAEEAAAAGAV